jgi:hypothetical protein
MKLFSNQAPKRESSIRVTLEYDAMFVRNMAKNLRDAIYDAPNIIKFVIDVIEEFETIKQNEMKKRNE